jgi:ABC-type multidrug transport system permease subunit
MLNILKKEWLRRLRSPVASVGLLLFPFLMTGMIGTVSSGGGSGPNFPTIEMLVWDQDEQWLSQQLVGMLGQDDMSEYVDATNVGEEGLAMMDKGKASAMLIIPEGFTDAVLNGEKTTLELIRNPAESIKPEIVELGGAVMATGLDMGSKVLGPESEIIAELLDRDEFPPADELLAVASDIINRLSSVQRYVFPLLLQIDTVKESVDGEEDSGGVNIFGIVLVMISVMSVHFVASRTILDFFDEEKTGMVKRQLVAPVTLGQIVRARLVFTVLFAVVIQAIVLGLGATFGWLAFGARFFTALVITAGFAFAAAGVFMMIYGVSRSEKQANLLNFIVIMGMSVLGGSFAPVDQIPVPIMQTIGHMTLNYWAIDAMQGQFVNAEPFASIGKAMLIFVLAGTVLNGLGSALAYKKLRAGLS